jgi:hypothetical protein
VINDHKSRRIPLELLIVAQASSLLPNNNRLEAYSTFPLELLIVAQASSLLPNNNRLEAYSTVNESTRP